MHCDVEFPPLYKCLKMHLKAARKAGTVRQWGKDGQVHCYYLLLSVTICDNRVTNPSPMVSPRATGFPRSARLAETWPNQTKPEPERGSIISNTRALSRSGSESGGADSRKRAEDPDGVAMTLARDLRQAETTPHHISVDSAARCGRARTCRCISYRLPVSRRT